MAMRYIIDGYNLIHRAGILAECNGDYNEAREILESALEHGFSRKTLKGDCLIFYDSSIRTRTAQPAQFGHVKIRFSAGKTADTSIIKYLEKMSVADREKITVVSSDGAVREKSMFLYAHTMSADEFWEMI